MVVWNTIGRYGTHTRLRILLMPRFSAGSFGCVGATHLSVRAFPGWEYSARSIRGGRAYQKPPHNTAVSRPGGGASIHLRH